MQIERNACVTQAMDDRTSLEDRSNLPIRRSLRMSAHASATYALSSVEQGSGAIGNSPVRAVVVPPVRVTTARTFRQRHSIQSGKVVP